VQAPGRAPAAPAPRAAPAAARRARPPGPNGVWGQCWGCRGESYQGRARAWGRLKMGAVGGTGPLPLRHGWLWRGPSRGRARARRGRWSDLGRRARGPRGAPRRGGALSVLCTVCSAERRPRHARPGVVVRKRGGQKEKGRGWAFEGGGRRGAGGQLAHPPPAAAPWALVATGCGRKPARSRARAASGRLLRPSPTRRAGARRGGLGPGSLRARPAGRGAAAAAGAPLTPARGTRCRRRR
jgi:hypothetical protein